ncbi:hypothetical protein [Limnoglobus roseus]|uniref:Uncharacterized protein n=1 Tax=Limnoglobus roseus TaxID=2598579 RepID=A0A5C1A8G0_9BACT|nr:hypothetical protein [Limnoglobus roseus]QEL14296.1 hypothetical protein PX52LOC_01168 [Limnoglobus roseus]
MRRIAKRAAVLVAVLGVGGASSSWLKSSGYDFWQYSTYRKQLQEGVTASETLDLHLEASEERLSLKEAAVRDFLDNRTTFAGLIDQFQQANENNGHLVRYMHDYYPTADAREIAARNAILFISASLSPDLSHRGAILNQVRSEFDRQFPHANPAL